MEIVATTHAERPPQLPRDVPFEYPSYSNQGGVISPRVAYAERLMAGSVMVPPFAPEGDRQWGRRSASPVRQPNWDRAYNNPPTPPPFSSGYEHSRMGSSPGPPPSYSNNNGNSDSNAWQTRLPPTRPASTSSQTTFTVRKTPQSAPVPQEAPVESVQPGRAASPVQKRDRRRGKARK